MSINVLLADDDPLVCAGLRALLEAQGDIRVTGVASNGFDAIQAAQRLQPDVIVMDSNVPGINGVDATHRICRRVPAAKVLILSTHESPDHVYRAWRAGARGYLLKGPGSEEIVAAVHAVHAGRHYLCNRISALGDLGIASCPEGPLEGLSAREREVLQAVVDGHRNAETARILSISVKTVETYRGRLMKKLGLRNLPGLVKFAIEQGLIQLAGERC